MRSVRFSSSLTRSLTLIALAPVALVGLARDARADEVAKPCEPEATQCAEAPVAYSKEIVLPIQAGFDTGWVPQSSPVQVHLWAQLWANSKVDLAGRFRTSWPNSLTLAATGTPGAGKLGIHYGVDIGAQAHIQIDVLGQTYSWTGDIPYLPQFDFQVDAEKEFDPWAFDGVTVSGSTQQQTLAQVSITSLIGLDIPGLDGGFALDTYIDLDAIYKTDLIRILNDIWPDSDQVTGGAIFKEDGLTFDDFQGGPFANFRVSPEGQIAYKGNLHLVPALYVSAIGFDYSIPIADIPIPFEFTQRDWRFEPVNVHVSLPDISLEGDDMTGPDGAEPAKNRIGFLEFGTIETGTTRTFSMSIKNTGEATLVGAAAIDEADPGAAAFTLEDGDVALDTSDEKPLTVTFAPEAAGDYVAMISIETNDPDEPTRLIELHASAADEPVDPPDDRADDTPAEEYGCDCALPASTGSRGAMPVFALGALVAGLRLGRKKRR
ncbi:MAG: hypothetical protein U0271_46465 [Polyangiaceae bacterium]